MGFIFHVSRTWEQALRKFPCMASGLLASFALIAWLGAGSLALAKGAPRSSPYAVIEVGSKGVKACVFDIDAARDDKCQADEEAYLKCLDLKQLKPRDVSPIKQEGFDDTVDAVAAHASELQNHYHVPSNRLYIVGSSGVAKIEHKDRLRTAIEEKVRPENSVDFISVENEAKYSFNGVLSLIPSRFRETRRRQVLLIDIGSGNTKGSYMEMSESTARLVGFGFPWGTVSVTDRINAHRGSGDFVAAAVDWRDNAFIPEIRSAFDRKPGTVSRDRVYLIGGLPWALVTLTQPANKQKFPRVTVDQIERLLRDATAADAEGRLCSQNPHNKPGSETERVCNVFSINNLIAGGQILKALAQEMKLSNESKRVFFIRDSQFAWPLGYLRSQLEGESDSP